MSSGLLPEVLDALNEIFYRPMKNARKRDIYRISWTEKDGVFAVDRIHNAASNADRNFAATSMTGSGKNPELDLDRYGRG